MKWDLIKCPKCEESGINQVLGGLLNGTLSILRFHGSHTNIIGRDFAVICSKCGEPVYIKHEKEKGGEDGTVGSIGTVGIHRESLS